VFATDVPFPANRRIVIALAAVLAAAGCGRIGPLEPPPDGSAAGKPPASGAQGTMEAMSPQVKPKIPPITPPNQPFILDPLLK
jgi:predicted small lipoprotein YifL